MADLNYVSPLTSDLTDYYTKTEVDELQQGDENRFATQAQITAGDNEVKGWVASQGYLTQHQSLQNYATKDYVDNAIEGIDGGGMRIRVVNVLPAEGEEGIFYLVYESNDEEENRYAEYIWSDTLNGYEMLGYGTGEGIMPDLTDYATKEWVGQQGYITSIGRVGADIVDYINTDSGLISETVQDAIDEVVDMLDDYAEAADLATVATTGDYDDLINKPTIPSLTGYATQTYVNDAIGVISIPDVSNFITANDLPDVSDMATETWVGNQGFLTQHQDISGKANSADLAAVATSGSYNDLSDKPSIPSISGLATESYVNTAVGNISIPDVSNFITAQDLPDVSIYAETANLATVATSGDYDDLTNKPSIPSTSGLASETWVQSQGYLTAHQDISGKANTADLATVATSGSYEDLSNKPTIPDVSSLSAQDISYTYPDLYPYYVKNVKQYLDIIIPALNSKVNTSSLAAVATSGDYTDLSNKPTIPTVPTNVSDFTNDAGYLTSHQNISGKVDGTVVSGTTTAKIFNEADGGGAQIITASARGFAGVHDGSNPDATYATMYVKNAAGTSTLARVDLDGDGKAYYLKNGASKADGSEIAVKGDIPDVSSFITSADLPDLTGYVESSDLATVATSGDYDDLLDKPDLSGFLTSSDLSGYAETANLATVATSGDYDDLTNKPTIPSLSGYATETWVGQQGYLTQHQDISGKANSADLATVATTGDYDDLTNKPTIPVLPTLATVATSGDYDDLTNKPTIPSNFIGSGAWIIAGLLGNVNPFNSSWITVVTDADSFKTAFEAGKMCIGNDYTSISLTYSNTWNKILFKRNGTTYTTTLSTGNPSTKNNTVTLRCGENLYIQIEARSTWTDADFFDVLSTTVKKCFLTYSNTNSGLTATTIQEAIDELAASAGGGITVQDAVDGVLDAVVDGDFIADTELDSNLRTGYKVELTPQYITFTNYNEDDMPLIESGIGYYSEYDYETVDNTDYQNSASINYSANYIAFNKSSNEVVSGDAVSDMDIAISPNFDDSVIEVNFYDNVSGDSDIQTIAFTKDIPSEVEWNYDENTYTLTLTGIIQHNDGGL